MEAVVPQTLPICVSPTGKDVVYALFSVLTFYATKSLETYGTISTPGLFPCMVLIPIFWV